MHRFLKEQRSITKASDFSQNNALAKKGATKNFCDDKFQQSGGLSSCVPIELPNERQVSSSVPQDLSHPMANFDDY